MVFRGAACLKKNYIGLELEMMKEVHSFSLVYVRIKCIIAIITLNDMMDVSALSAGEL